MGSTAQCEEDEEMAGGAGCCGRPAPAAALQELSVGEVARRSGVAVSTLHFYEKRGLIASARTAGNQRRYPRAVLRRVAVIKVAQRMGVPLAEIAEALSLLPAGEVPDKADWTALSARWRSQLEQRIAGLVQLRDQLDTCIGCGCLSLKACPLRNEGDALAAAGPGPHFAAGAPATGAAEGASVPIAAGAAAAR